MHFKWLEDFIAYAETRSFTRAAELRNVTHPAFGRRIKSLESWVGAALIDRGSFPSTLTPEGERFLEVAKLMVAELGDVRTELRQSKTRNGQIVTFATGRTLARTLFPTIHAELGQSKRKVQLRLMTTTVHDGLILLADGGADLLMCYAGQGASIDIEDAEYEMAKLTSDMLIAVATQAIAQKVLAGLAGGRAPAPLLTYSENMALGRVMRGALQRSRLNGRVEIAFESDIAEAIHSAALQGRGLAWLPERLVEDDLAAGRLVRIDTPLGDVPLEVRLYRKRRNQRPTVQNVWQGVLQAVAELTPKLGK